MVSKFAIGSIVRLKSSGPEMTVQTIPTESSHFYRCQWFAGKKLEAGTFQEASLEKITETK